MKKLISILLSLVFCTMSSGIAQVTTDVPYKTPAMGALMGSNIALSETASSVFLNPATLNTTEHGFVLFSTQKVFNQSFLPYNVFSAGLDLPNGFGKLGISFESMSVNYRDETLSGETAIGLSHAFTLREERVSTLNMGYTVKYMSVDYGQSAGLSGDGSDGLDLGNATAFGFDLGFQATLSKRHWLGVVVHNINRPQIGSGSATSMLPRDIQAGFSYAPTRQVVTSFSLVSSPGLTSEFHGGLEYELNPYLTLRGGIQSVPNRFGAGFSFQANGLELDYTILTHPILPATHQFSFAYGFQSIF